MTASIDLTQLDESTLAALLAECATDAAIEELLAELDRRDQAEQTDRAIDALVARGWDYSDAFAQVHGIDPVELARQERHAVLAFHRRPGESAQQVSDRLYRDHVAEQYAAAERDTRGHMLNAAGRAAGVDPRSLFSGAAKRVRKYASAELRTWFYQHGRTTLVEYRALMIGRPTDVAKAARVDRDYGEAVA